MEGISKCVGIYSFQKPRNQPTQNDITTYKRYKHFRDYFVRVSVKVECISSKHVLWKCLEIHLLHPALSPSYPPYPNLYFLLEGRENHKDPFRNFLGAENPSIAFYGPGKVNLMESCIPRSLPLVTWNDLGLGGNEEWRVRVVEEAQGWKSERPGLEFQLYTYAHCATVGLLKCSQYNVPNRELG